jgi:hypothetical protein
MIFINIKIDIPRGRLRRPRVIEVVALTLKREGEALKSGLYISDFSYLSLFITGDLREHRTILFWQASKQAGRQAGRQAGNE